MIWVSIDDEQAYMKVLLDEVFGRANFVRSVVWQKRTSPDARLNLGDSHDYILVYGKNRDRFQEVAHKVALSAERTVPRTTRILTTIPAALGLRSI